MKESFHHRSALFIATCGARNVCEGRYETIIVLIILSNKTIKTTIARVSKTFKKK